MVELNGIDFQQNFKASTIHSHFEFDLIDKKNFSETFHKVIQLFYVRHIFLIFNHL